MSRIFISYKREDKDKVLPLKDKIEAATGEKCWIDLDGIESDAQFANVIIKAIDEADIFLFMYSKQHTKIKDYEADWTVREINYAQAEGKRIVFLNLDGTLLTKWFKFMFTSKQQVDATSDEVFKHLLSDINKWLGNESSLIDQQTPVKQEDNSVVSLIEQINLVKRIDMSKRPKWQKVLFKTIIYTFCTIVILALIISFWVVYILSTRNKSEDKISRNSTPIFAQRVIDAYPQYNIKFENDHLIFPDGTALLYDDQREKSFLGKLDSCDIEDMFSMAYDTTLAIPEYLNDGGRARNEQLFKKMYGNCDDEVRQNLVRVSWFGKNIFFTQVNDAAKHLESVAAELESYPQYKQYLTDASTFNWRTIKNTQRLSSHSFGIAIDLNSTYANYWKWSHPRSSEVDSIQYKNRIPIEIVRVFEKHGFIWGGRWYHYDTTHFEYRPELLCAN